MERQRHLYPRADGSVIYSTKFFIVGPVSRFASWFYGGTVNKGLKDEAAALKTYCEEHYPLTEDALQEHVNPYTQAPT